MNKTRAIFREKKLFVIILALKRQDKILRQSFVIRSVIGKTKHKFFKQK
jgi:hypothetical protein